MTSSQLLSSAAALMALSGILMAINARLALGRRCWQPEPAWPWPHGTFTKPKEKMKRRKNNE